MIEVGQVTTIYKVFPTMLCLKNTTLISKYCSVFNGIFGSQGSHDMVTTIHDYPVTQIRHKMPCNNLR